MKISQASQQDQDVQCQGQVGYDPRQAIIDQHEQDNEDAADQSSREPLSDRILPERWTDDAFILDAHRRR